jgi:hypothetical protein
MAARLLASWHAQPPPRIEMTAPGKRLALTIHLPGIVARTSRDDD